MATMTTTAAPVVSMGMVEGFIKSTFRKLGRTGIEERVGIWVFPDATAAHIIGRDADRAAGAVCVWEEPSIGRNDWNAPDDAWEMWFAAGRRDEMMTQLRAAGFEVRD